MLGEERLVARDDWFTALDRAEDEFKRFLDAAHQFHHDLDGGIVEQISPIRGKELLRQLDRALFGRILDRDPSDNEVASDPLTEERSVFFQIEENPGSDRTKAGQTYS